MSRGFTTTCFFVYAVRADSPDCTKGTALPEAAQRYGERRDSAATEASPPVTIIVATAKQWLGPSAEGLCVAQRESQCGHRMTYWFANW